MKSYFCRDDKSLILLSFFFTVFPERIRAIPLCTRTLTLFSIKVTKWKTPILHDKKCKLINNFLMILMIAEINVFCFMEWKQFVFSSGYIP